MILLVKAGESIHKSVDIIEFLEYLGEESEVHQVIEEEDQTVKENFLKESGQDALVEGVSQVFDV